MTPTGLYYLNEGFALAFFFILAIQNLYRRNDRLRKILGAILLYWGAQQLLSVAFTSDFVSNKRIFSQLINTIDMTAEPTCCFLLLELCRPGWLTWKKVIYNELPFLALGTLYIFSENENFYWIFIAFFVAYGTGVFITVLRYIPRYNQFLRQHYSYDENVNLRWLYIVLVTFFVLMFVYAYTIFTDTLVGDIIYIILSVASWSWICYCIYRQESVLTELEDSRREESLLQPADDQEDIDSALIEIAPMIDDRFLAPKLYLDPQLKLGDMARAVGTNRTYLSRYLNEVLHTNFYNFVNSLRLEHASALISNAKYGINEIATMSGFNSYSTFRRSFISKYGLTPQEYRNKSK